MQGNHFKQSIYRRIQLEELQEQYHDKENHFKEWICRRFQPEGLGEQQKDHENHPKHKIYIRIQFEGLREQYNDQENHLKQSICRRIHPEETGTVERLGKAVQAEHLQNNPARKIAGSVQNQENHLIEHMYKNPAR